MLYSPFQSGLGMICAFIIKALRVTAICMIVFWAVCTSSQRASAQSCIVSLNLPEQLDKYRKVVENETGRPICLRRSDNFNMASARAEFTTDNTYVVIKIDRQYDPADPSNEFELAHELTHGRLISARCLIFCRVLYQISS
jgi:hypothetical protein